MKAYDYFDNTIRWILGLDPKKNIELQKQQIINYDNKTTIRFNMFNKEPSNRFFKHFNNSNDTFQSIKPSDTSNEIRKQENDKQENDKQENDKQENDKQENDKQENDKQKNDKQENDKQENDKIIRSGTKKEYEERREKEYGNTL
jgi:hypothetical protein